MQPPTLLPCTWVVGEEYTNRIKAAAEEWVGAVCSQVRGSTSALPSPCFACRSVYSFQAKAMRTACHTDAACCTTCCTTT